MNFDSEFPLKFWINNGRHEARRLETEEHLEDLGIAAERFPTVNVRKTAERGGNSATNATGHEKSERYALALTQRMALREASRRKSPALLLLKDNVAFHPNFLALISPVVLPSDWGIFYLGCSHNEQPVWSGPRVVRVKSAVHTHAFAVRAPYYRRVMKALELAARAGTSGSESPDQILGRLLSDIPAYACYPNLVWQRVSPTQTGEVKYNGYTKDGRQMDRLWAIENLLPDLVSGNVPAFETEGEIENTSRDLPPPQPAPSVQDPKTVRHKESEPRLGLLFLTRGDVNHPHIWSEFVAQSPGRCRVFTHAKFPRQLKGGFLDGTAIHARIDTSWADISLVRASRELLLEALEDPKLTHFVLLSESCVPVRPLPDILRRLELDPRPRFNFHTVEESSVSLVSRTFAVPQVPRRCWRFQSQWWLLDRVAATFAAGQDFTDDFEDMVIPDEAYFATLLSIQGYPLEGEVMKKEATWTWFEADASSPTDWQTLPKERLLDIIHSDALFARKFPKNADVGKYGLHRLSNHSSPG